MAKQLSVTRLDDVINSKHEDALVINRVWLLRVSKPIKSWLNAFVDKVVEKNPQIGKRQSVNDLQIVGPWFGDSSHIESPMEECAEIARAYQTPGGRTATYIYCGVQSITTEVYRPGRCVGETYACHANCEVEGYFPETQRTFAFKASTIGENAKEITSKLVSDARKLTKDHRSEFRVIQRLDLSAGWRTGCF